METTRAIFTIIATSIEGFLSTVEEEEGQLHQMHYQINIRCTTFPSSLSYTVITAKYPKLYSISYCIYRSSPTKLYFLAHFLMSFTNISLMLVNGVKNLINRVNLFTKGPTYTAFVDRTPRLFYRIIDTVSTLLQSLPCRCTALYVYPTVSTNFAHLSTLWKPPPNLCFSDAYTSV